jgi:hypothetical protein
LYVTPYTRNSEAILVVIMVFKPLHDGNSIGIRNFWGVIFILSPREKLFNLMGII